MWYLLIVLVDRKLFLSIESLCCAGRHLHRYYTKAHTIVTQTLFKTQKNQWYIHVYKRMERNETVSKTRVNERVSKFIQSIQAAVFISESGLMLFNQHACVSDSLPLSVYVCKCMSQHFVYICIFPPFINVLFNIM